jgi:tetratricopeptide (TPR) repeat protein
MHFDPNNKVIQLCAKGMKLEATQPLKAKALFMQAWNEAETNIEKFAAAHYVARHQLSTADKLHWDETALNLALQIEEDSIKSNFPSLYLNIAKCYEDLKDYYNARINYQKALSHENKLPNDGYGQMIRSGIRNGIIRVAEL